MKGSDVFPSKWLTAADLQGHEPTVVISRVTLEDISSTDRKPVIYFQGKKKGMVCNKTNWNRIAHIYKSDDSDDWTGKEITLYVELVDMQGQMKEAIRVKAPRKSPAGNGERRLEVQDRGSYKTSSMKPAEPPADDADEPIPF